MSHVYQPKRILWTIIGIVLTIMLISALGISRCHQQARQSCEGQVQMVSVMWGVGCDFECNSG